MVVFGGCTINIIKENFITDYINIIKDEYFSKFATELDHTIAYPDSGIEVKNYLKTLWQKPLVKLLNTEGRLKI